MLLVYLGLAILIYMQFGAGTDLKRNRTVCIAIAVYLFLISAMKAIGGDGDLLGYANSYKNINAYWTYADLIRAARGDYIKDVVFYIVGKFIAQLGFNEYGWMALISLLFAAGVAWFVYCNSGKPMLSLMLLMTLEYFKFSLSGLRQTVALAIVLLISYGYILERRPIRFIISVVIASAFHSSALLFLPAYVVASWKIGWKQVALVFGTFIIYYLFPNAVRQVLASFTWAENLAAYADSTATLSWSGVVIHGCILIFCIMFRNETTLDPYLHWRRVDAFINCMIVGLCLQVFATMIAEAFRMAYYYNICCIAVVPNLVVENKRESNHSTMYLILAACLVAYMLWSRAYFDIVYFWQGYS